MEEIERIKRSLGSDRSDQSNQTPVSSVEDVSRVIYPIGLSEVVEQIVDDSSIAMDLETCGETKEERIEPVDR